MTQTAPLTWDYTDLAESYSSRPLYTQRAVDEVVAAAGVGHGDLVCDIGAGTGHLTVQLLEHGLQVDAVEPNDNMRAIGQERTRDVPAVTWYAARAEDTGRAADAYPLVTFGSSFSVVRHTDALPEVARILKPRGWMACIWNHRDLDDPLQREIEAAIRSHVPDYDYGFRRRNDAEVLIEESDLFEAPVRIEADTVHTVDRDVWIEAWRSHATLSRQAGAKTDAVIEEIEAIVDQHASGPQLDVPYVTRGWMTRAVT